MILAGIDEAGYGPMLGPLVVSAAVFRVSDEIAPADGDAPSIDLWSLLAPLVGREPKSAAIPVGDSKKLYDRRKGLVHLEEGLLPFVAVSRGEVPPSLRQLLRSVARRGRAGAAEYLDAYAWYEGRDVSLPRDSFRGHVKKLSARLEERLSEAGVEFLGLACVPMEVLEFNARLDDVGKKSEVSFAAVAHLLSRVWRRFATEPTEVVVDRQGARTRYAPHLFRALGPRGVHIDEQGSEQSLYRLTRRDGGPEFRVRFTSEAEDDHLPVALGSMLSKYVRELHMAAFNEYWIERSPGLRPTAGYVQDARRFLAETVDLRRELRVDETSLVRRK